MKDKLIQMLRWSERYTKTDMVYLARGGFWTNASYIFVSLLGFISSVFFARFLTQQEFGMYQYVLAITGIIGATTLTGMNNAATRAVARGSEGDIRKATKFQLLFGFIPTLTALAVVFWYYAHGNTELSTAFLWVALFLPITNAVNTWAAFVSGKKEFRRGFYYGITNALFSYGGTLLALYFTRNFVWIVFGNLFFSLMGHLLLYTLTVRRIPKDAPTDPTTIPYGTHLSVMAIPSTLASHLDALLVFQFIGPEALAIYAFATLLPEKLTGSLKFMSAIAFPRFSEMSEDAVKLFLRKKIWLILTFPAVCAIGYAALAPYLFKIFFPAYTASIIFTQVYALSFFSVGASVIQSALMSQKKTKELYYVSLLIPLIKTILLLVFMYHFGLWGLIWAQILSNFISILFQMNIFIKRQ